MLPLFLDNTQSITVLEILDVIAAKQDVVSAKPMSLFRILTTTSFYLSEGVALVDPSGFSMLESSY